MPIKVKNWKLMLLAFMLIGIMISLGYWQLSRAKEKRALLATLNHQLKQAPLLINDQLLSKYTLTALRFYRVKLIGHFDNAHTILLDNKIHDGKIGYEIYTPFIAQGLSPVVLIDRGFISIGQSRNQFPTIPALTGERTIIGFFDAPPQYVAFGQMAEEDKHWPLRVQYINTNQLVRFTSYPLLSYLLILNTNTWHLTTMSPEKHQAYAMQWFALALTLLILCFALNRSK